MGWRSKVVEQPVGLPADLLAAYEATRVPAGRSTGLPAAPRRRSEPPAPAAPATPATMLPPAPPSLVLVPRPRLDDRGPATGLDRRDDDRRSATRHDTVLPVLATVPGDDEGALGRCINVAAGGLLVEMPFDAPDRHLDVVVGDDECAIVWAKVVSERPADRGVLWHLQVVTADDAWPALVARAAAAARVD